MGEPHCWSHACDYLNTIKISADKNVQDHFTPTPAGKSLPRISVDSRLRRRVGGVVCTLHTWSPQLKKGLKQPIIQHSKPSNLWQNIDSQLIPVHAHSFNLQSNRCKPTPVIIPLSIQTLVWISTPMCSLVIVTTNLFFYKVKTSVLVTIPLHCVASMVFPHVVFPIPTQPINWSKPNDQQWDWCNFISLNNDPTSALTISFPV